MGDSEDFIKIRKEKFEEVVEKKVEEELEDRKKEPRKDKKDGDISRRDFLKKAGLGVAGIGALSLSPTAANLKLTKNGIFGSTTQSQQIQDLETLNIDTVNANNTRTKTAGNGKIHYVADYDGSSTDERLDNALSAASSTETVILENGLSVNGDRTISKRLSIITNEGIGATRFPDGGDTLTLNAPVHLAGMTVRGTINVDNSHCILERINFTGGQESINVKQNGVLISMVQSDGGGGSVTFESGTSNGEIGIVNGNVSVTDNGSNRIL